MVHLIKKYPELQAVDTLLLSIWKIFKYSSVKQTIFEHTQTTEGLKQVKILKAPLVGDTSARVIFLFKQPVVALDTLFHERKDQEENGIRKHLLKPTLIMTLVFLAEVLVLIKRFCAFLQTSELNYGLIIGKF